LIAAADARSSSRAHPGEVRIGAMSVHRLGFGTMRLTGAEAWGPPADRQAAIRTLQALPELGVNFVDTADSYGPEVAEDLVREALFPYDGVVVATKGGLVRASSENRWLDGRPEHLVAAAKRSRDRLGVEAIDLWQLHRIDGEVPADEQFGAIRTLLDEGVIRHAGLCEVSVVQIEAAQRVFPVSAVQNRYNFLDRRSERVVDHCAAAGICFIAWFPLRGGALAKPTSVLAEAARARGATPAQVALAFILARSPAILPIPGASKLAQLRENLAAGSLSLTKAELAALARLRALPKS
jgi:pyridoxine 4-dehydrogenase